MKGQTDAPFFSQLKFTVPVQVSQNLGCNVPPLKMQSHVVLVNVLKSASLNSLMTCVMSCLVLKQFSWDREGQHASQNHLFFTLFQGSILQCVIKWPIFGGIKPCKYMVNWRNFPCCLLFVHCLAWCHFFWEHLGCSTRWRICEHEYFEFSAVVKSRFDLWWKNARKHR